MQFSRVWFRKEVEFQIGVPADEAIQVIAADLSAQDPSSKVIGNVSDRAFSVRIRRRLVNFIAPTLEGTVDGDQFGNATISAVIAPDRSVGMLFIFMWLVAAVAVVCVGCTLGEAVVSQRAVVMWDLLAVLFPTGLLALLFLGQKYRSRNDESRLLEWLQQLTAGMNVTAQSMKLTGTLKKPSTQSRPNELEISTPAAPDLLTAGLSGAVAGTGGAPSALPGLQNKRFTGTVDGTAFRIRVCHSFANIAAPELRGHIEDRGRDGSLIKACFRSYLSSGISGSFRFAIYYSALVLSIAAVLLWGARLSADIILLGLLVPVAPFLFGLLALELQLFPARHDEQSLRQLVSALATSNTQSAGQ